VAVSWLLSRPATPKGGRAKCIRDSLLWRRRRRPRRKRQQGERTLPPKCVPKGFPLPYRTTPTLPAAARVFMGRVLSANFGRNEGFPSLPFGCPWERNPNRCRHAPLQPRSKPQRGSRISREERQPDTLRGRVGVTACHALLLLLSESEAQFPFSAQATDHFFAWRPLLFARRWVRIQCSVCSPSSAAAANEHRHTNARRRRRRTPRQTRPCRQSATARRDVSASESSSEAAAAVARP